MLIAFKLLSFVLTKVNDESNNKSQNAILKFLNHKS